MDTAAKLTGTRALIARKMRESLRETAQLTFHAEADASAIMDDKAVCRARGDIASIEDFVLATVAGLLVQYPDFNARWAGEAIERRPDVDLSFALATERGLMTPTIFDAAALDVEALSVKRRELAARARDNKLSIKDLTGGSFTVSNLGYSRVRYFTPILNYPQLGILGIGQISSRFVIGGDGVPKECPFMGLSLTVDHAVIDGAPAADFLTALCEGLENGVWKDAGRVRS